MTSHSSPPRPIDLTHVYIGLDNSQPNAIRAVCLDADATLNPNPIWFERFKDLEGLQRTLLPFLTPDASVGAISKRRGGHNTFGAMTWLRSTGLRVSGPGSPVDWHSFGDDCESYGLGRSFRRAFALARAVAYRHQLPRLVWDVFYEADYLSRELTGLVGRLTRLACVVPFPYGVESAASKPKADRDLIDCPF